MRNINGWDYKVRFHLGKGENFKKWRVESKDKLVNFYCPTKNSFVLHESFLRNQKGTANKIYQGESKTVCAWIESIDMDIIDYSNLNDYNLIFVSNFLNYFIKNNTLDYNPRKNPHWNLDSGNVDGCSYKLLFTYKIGRAHV